MKLYKFKVTFTNWNIEFVLASCTDDAEILAQAEQIKKGNSHIIFKTEKMEQ
jgi:hypothetical protein